MDGVPVRDVEDRREGVADDVGRGQDPGHDRHDDADDGDEQEQRRQEPPGATGPEPTEPDRPASTPLLNQQRRDEEAREHEEGVDAVEAARHRVEPGVEGDDGEHRQGPDAVQAPDVAQRRAGPGCVSVRAHVAPGSAARGGGPSVPYWGNVHRSRALLPRARAGPDDRRVLRIGILGAARIAPIALVKPARRTGRAESPRWPRATATAPAEFARKQGIPRVLDSYAELVDDPDIDAVYNPLPNGLHGYWTIAALKAGKHVLCEKPFTANADEARAVAEVDNGNPGVVVMEAFHYQYHPLAKRLVEIVRSGELGTITQRRRRLLGAAVEEGRHPLPAGAGRRRHDGHGLLPHQPAAPPGPRARGSSAPRRSSPPPASTGPWTRTSRCPTAGAPTSAAPCSPPRCCASTRRSPATTARSPSSTPSAPSTATG